MAFREVQRFWLNRLMVVLTVVVATVLLVLAFAPGPWQEKGPGGFVLVFALRPVVLPALMSLKTEVDERSVYVGFHPLRQGRRRIPLSNVEAAEAVTYEPGNFGYGVRIGVGGERAYNVAGRRGVRLHLLGGKSLLIGSQRPDELASAISARTTTTRVKV